MEFLYECEYTAEIGIGKQGSHKAADYGEYEHRYSADQNLVLVACVGDYELFVDVDCKYRRGRIEHRRERAYHSTQQRREYKAPKPESLRKHFAY